MSRKNVEQIVAAAHGALVDGERVTEFGTCWAAQLKHRVPVLVTARRQYLMVLTDRRLLLFTRRRRKALRASDLVIGKRYEAFSVSKVRRALPLFSVRVEASNGARMVFEFRPGQRQLGGALVARLTPAQPALPAAPDLTPTPVAPTLGGRAWPGDDTDATKPIDAPDSRRPDATRPGDAPIQAGPAAATNARDAAAEETTFWGPSTRGA
jgi:hypothetical protein